MQKVFFQMIAEVSQIQDQLQEKWLILEGSLILSLFALGLAWRFGLFRPFQASAFPQIHGKDVLKGFGYFLFIEILLIPALIGLIFIMKGEDLKNALNVNSQLRSWINLLIIMGGFGGVTFAYLELTSVQRLQIWGQHEHPWYYQIGMGIIAWLVSYPLVLSLSEGISLLIWHFFHQPFVEQVAVQNVRQSMENPLLFGLTAIAVIIVVPLTEELLFRGLLQSWFKRKFHNTLIGIMLSSLIFALFHYSGNHGMTNVELLSSLFFLSCMLGYIYERQRSLWAPIGMHSFFNFISLLMIFTNPVNE